jgi:transposase-like protein
LFPHMMQRRLCILLSMYSFTHWRKKSIVTEAYAVDKIIKSIAQKWRAQPNQICKWWRQLLEDKPLHQYLELCTIEKCTVIKEHKGRPIANDE